MSTQQLVLVLLAALNAGCAAIAAFNDALPLVARVALVFTTAASGVALTTLRGFKDAA